MKQRKKKNFKNQARSLICSTSGYKGVMEFQDGTRKNSQSRIQNEINLHNQGKKTINAS
jgi:hypothetical protein